MPSLLTNFSSSQAFIQLWAVLDFIENKAKFKVDEERELQADGNRYVITNRGKITLSDIDNKDAFAKAEGFKDWAEYSNPNRENYSLSKGGSGRGKTSNGKGKGRGKGKGKGKGK